jgi:hypothetical protein
MPAFGWGIVAVLVFIALVVLVLWLSFGWKFD